MIKVIDNLIDQKNYEEIYEAMIDCYFPWYINTGTVGENDKHYQLVHGFYINNQVNSPFIDILTPIFNNLEIPSFDNLLRVKANLSPKRDSNFESGMHTDFENTDQRHKTAVYYLNTNNGATKFNSGVEVKSVKNRAVIFDTDLLHTSVETTDADYRIVLNINWKTHL